MEGLDAVALAQSEKHNSGNCLRCVVLPNLRDIYPCPQPQLQAHRIAVAVPCSPLCWRRFWLPLECKRELLQSEVPRHLELSR